MGTRFENEANDKSEMAYFRYPTEASGLRHKTEGWSGYELVLHISVKEIYQFVFLHAKYFFFFS